MTNLYNYKAIYHVTNFKLPDQKTLSLIISGCINGFDGINSQLNGCCYHHQKCYLYSGEPNLRRLLRQSW